MRFRHAKLEASGALQPLVRDPSLGATRPLLEDEIRDTIKSLEASTTAVQQQSRLLSLQCETIKKQLRSRENLEQEKTRDIARLRKKHEAEKQNTASLVTIPHVERIWNEYMLREINLLGKRTFWRARC